MKSIAIGTDAYLLSGAYLAIALELTTRVLRSTIDDYAMHAPEQLKQSVVTDQLLDMLERYLLP